MTNLESLLSLSNYPIPNSTLINICETRGIVSDDTVDRTLIAYQLSIADTYMFLSTAPDLNENGVSISFSEKERSIFINLADRIYNKYDKDSGSGIVGFVGENFNGN